jgi:hypothetical protein
MVGLGVSTSMYPVEWFIFFFRSPGKHFMVNVLERIRGWEDPRAGLNDLEKRKFLTLLGF